MWSVAKALQIPIDGKFKEIRDLPYTISFVIRKRQQIDSLNDLPKDKRPPDRMIWEGSSDDIDDWLERVFNKKETQRVELLVDEIEG